MRINTKRNQGFTLVEIMIVVAIIGLLAAIAIPNFVRARESAQANACINNLRQIDGAKQQWALEERALPNATSPDAELILYLGRSGTLALPVCPVGDAAYTIGAVNATPLCTSGIVTHVLD